MNKLLVICGPTATGKTSLAVKLAKEFDGKIISADSRQVYRGMDIGTGKDHPRDVTVRLIDVVNPDEKFNVAKYYNLAWKVIKDVWKREKSRPKVEDPRRKASGLPIIVGGTGFYIKAVVNGIETIGVEPDWEMRKILGDYDIKILGKMLRRIDPERWKKMNESDQQNPRRLIRAIEIATAIPKESRAAGKAQKSPNIQYLISNILMIGLTAPNKVLYQRIDQRVEERVRQGVEEEIRKLLDKGYTWEASALGETLGYKEWQPFLEGKASKKEAIQRWKFAEHAYARRQMTWFKKALRQAQGVWFDITQPNFEKEVVKLVEKWYSKNAVET